MTKTERELRRLFESLGLTITGAKHTGHAHLQFKLADTAGKTMLYTTSLSPSDWRRLANIESDVRRHFGIERKKNGK